GRPVLFSQPRVGLHGRTFILRKFRTMVPDAEARFGEVAHLNERQGPVFKVEKDPRVTRFGRILRATSLDELPQLWNVLRGEMSLVGPRPPLHIEVEQYDPWHRRRLSMKPGMTGLWQVSNRNEASFDNWVSLDLQYIDTWSLTSDLRILARTIPAVIRLTGK
ncbi:MAG: sugar transferase, partial [bacterium]